MRSVLHISKVKGIAGAENHLLALLPQLRGAGHDPTMLVLRGPRDCPEEFVARLRAKEITVDVLPMRSNLDPALAWRLYRYLAVREFELVHTHLFHADVYGALAAVCARKGPIVTTKHGFNPWRSRRLYAWLDRAAARVQSSIITISRAIGKWLVRTEGLPEAKMTVVHYALDGEQFRFVPASAVELPPGHPVVGTVSRLIDQKQVDVLIRAVAACRARYPDMVLLVAGDGPERQRLIDLSTDLGVSDRVFFLGHYAQVSALMRHLDIFALPTAGEGFGLVVLEAYAWSTPVVVSNVLALPEIVDHDITGLLVPPGDVTQLARALRRLADDPVLRDRIGAAGRRRLEREFTPERMTEQTVAVYEAALQSPRTYWR